MLRKFNLCSIKNLKVKTFYTEKSLQSELMFYFFPAVWSPPINQPVMYLFNNHNHKILNNYGNRFAPFPKSSSLLPQTFQESRPKKLTRRKKDGKMFDFGKVPPPAKTTRRKRAQQKGREKTHQDYNKPPATTSSSPSSSPQRWW